jgi:hypothetical protein
MLVQRSQIGLHRVSELNVLGVVSQRRNSVRSLEVGTDPWIVNNANQSGMSFECPYRSYMLGYFKRTPRQPIQHQFQFQTLFLIFRPFL